jgi:hypothetical protein
MILLLCSFILSACDAVTRDDFFGSRSGRTATPEEMSEIIERLVPETQTTRPRLRAVIEATMRVTGMPRSEFPERRVTVVNVLRSLSFGDLRRIETILPDVERNPKLTWPDD